MQKLPLQYVKTLYLRFASIWGEKFTRHAPSDDFIQIWWDDWAAGLAGIDAQQIKEALDECRMSLSWPPSLAEFRALCEKAGGMPSMEKCLQAAIRKEFFHPMVKLVYDHVGSWSLKNDKDDVLRDKVKSAYQEALSSFRKDPQAAYLALEQYQQQPALPEPPPKQLTEKEKQNVRDILATCKAKAAESHNTPKLVMPAWEKEKITPGLKTFDRSQFEKRKSYLKKLNEFEAANLSQDDFYDRLRFLREDLSDEFLKKVNNQSHLKQEPVQNNYTSSKTVYKHWMSD